MKKLENYDLIVLESRPEGEDSLDQITKRLIKFFTVHGAKFDRALLIKLRDTGQQIDLLGIPEEFAYDHLYAEFRLQSPNRQTCLELIYQDLGGESEISAVLNGKMIVFADLNRSKARGIRKVLAMLALHNLI